MKKTICCLFINVALSAFCMESDVDSKINVIYQPAVKAMGLELFSVRSKSDTEKEQLFEKSKEIFPLGNAVERIKQLNNPQVIVWFAGYFGSVTKNNAQWYKDTIFNKIPNAKFWLTDLYAWNFLSVDAQQLKKNNPRLVSKLLEEGLSAEECPLIIQSSPVINEELERMSQFKVLSSRSFFRWLLTCENDSLLTDDVCNQLCRDTIRSTALPCSLAQFGYKPRLFDRSVERLDSQNMLEVNFSLVYPLLQYLEAAFYVSQVIASQPSDKKCEVVFLLPNKEFTYFQVPGEEECFGNFKQVVKSLIASSDVGRSISIIFEPFAYGKDFYDAPYRLGGTRYKNKKALIDEIQN